MDETEVVERGGANAETCEIELRNEERLVLGVIVGVTPLEGDGELVINDQFDGWVAGPITIANGPIEQECPDDCLLSVRGRLKVVVKWRPKGRKKRRPSDDQEPPEDKRTIH